MEVAHVICPSFDNKGTTYFRLLFANRTRGVELLDLIFS